MQGSAWQRLGTISIHALLAESDASVLKPCAIKWQFLSTLSLRRATLTPEEVKELLNHFYPRSPCGERPHLAL